MKEQLETAAPRRKLGAGDSDEACKTATGHNCQPSCKMRPKWQIVRY